MIDYADQSAEEIAAHFPVLSDDVADRLIDLLLPLPYTQPKPEQAA